MATDDHVLQVGDDVGWISSHLLQEMDPMAEGRQRHQPVTDTNPRRWDSKKVIHYDVAFGTVSPVLEIISTVSLALTSLPRYPPVEHSS